MSLRYTITNLKTKREAAGLGTLSLGLYGSGDLVSDKPIPGSRCGSKLDLDYGGHLLGEGMTREAAVYLGTLHNQFPEIAEAAESIENLQLSLDKIGDALGSARFPAVPIEILLDTAARALVVREEACNRLVERDNKLGERIKTLRDQIGADESLTLEGVVLGMHEELKRLRYEACLFFEEDGTTTLTSPERALERRKESARILQILNNSVKELTAERNKARIYAKQAEGQEESYRCQLRALKFDYDAQARNLQIMTDSLKSTVEALRVLLGDAELLNLDEVIREVGMRLKRSTAIDAWHEARAEIGNLHEQLAKSQKDCAEVSQTLMEQCHSSEKIREELVNAHRILNKAGILTAFEGAPTYPLCDRIAQLLNSSDAIGMGVEAPCGGR